MTDISLKDAVIRFLHDNLTINQSPVQYQEGDISPIKKVKDELFLSVRTDQYYDFPTTKELIITAFPDLLVSKMDREPYILVRIKHPDAILHHYNACDQ